MAGHVVDEKGVNVHDPCRAVQDLGLVLFHPQEFVKGGRGVWWLAGDAVYVLRTELGDLLARPRIEPQHRGP